MYSDSEIETLDTCNPTVFHNVFHHLCQCWSGGWGVLQPSDLSRGFFNGTGTCQHCDITGVLSLGTDAGLRLWSGMAQYLVYMCECFILFNLLFYWTVIFFSQWISFLWILNAIFKKQYNCLLNLWVCLIGKFQGFIVIIMDQFYASWYYEFRMGQFFRLTWRMEWSMIYAGMQSTD